MKVTVKKQVEVEIQSPSWYEEKYSGSILLIADNNCISANKDFIMVQGVLYDHQLASLERGNFTPITEKEFWAKYELINNGIKERCEKLITESISAEK